ETSAFSSENVPSDYSSADRQIAEDTEKYHIPAMAAAVVDKNSILFEKTYGNCKSVDQPFIIGSMSKSFTAAAVMRLYEQGRLDLDSPIDEYIDTSEWFAENSDHSRITVRDLLNHTSGITTYQTFGSLKCSEQYGSYEYANANYGLLGLIIETVSGMSYEQYIEQNIFEPLGMSHSAASLEKSRENGLIEGYRNFFGIPVAGEPDYPDRIEKGAWTNIPAGYLSSSLSDMEKYLQMYLRNGENVLSHESINRMFYDNVPAGEGIYYGMGWNYADKMYSQPILMHAGLVENYTSNMFIIPDKGIAIVVLVNMNDYLVGNNLLENVVMPLLGEPKQELPNMYLILHAVIDAVYFAIFFISIYSVVTLKKWKTKTAEKKYFVTDIIRHLLLPALLLAIPPITGTPYMVIWLFVKDLMSVIIINAVLLLSVGVYKTVFLVKNCKSRSK
ncbi:MAG: beta-lactamase family protein, partial [Ruminiclostridium sp.]|nr:beta-lactamase family protein [Ruminiclostridium sp.]